MACIILLLDSTDLDQIYSREINTFKRFVGFVQNILPLFVITKGNVNIFQNIIF